MFNMKKIIEKCLSLAKHISIDKLIRGNQKLKILHGEIKEELKKRLEENGLHNEYIICSLDEKNGKEIKYIGAFYEKDSDITIMDKNRKIISVIEAKMPMSNYLQNKNNYFEGLLGQCSNARNAGIKFYYMEFVCQNSPYFKKDKISGKKIVSKLEHYKTNHFENKARLMELSDLRTERPNALSLYFYKLAKHIEIGDTKEQYKQKIINNKVLEENIKGIKSSGDFFVNDMNAFIDKIIDDLKNIHNENNEI